MAQVFDRQYKHRFNICTVRVTDHVYPMISAARAELYPYTGSSSSSSGNVCDGNFIYSPTITVTAHTVHHSFGMHPNACEPAYQCNR